MGGRGTSREWKGGAAPSQSSTTLPEVRWGGGGWDEKKPKRGWKGENGERRGRGRGKPGRGWEEGGGVGVGGEGGGSGREGSGKVRVKRG